MDSEKIEGLVAPLEAVLFTAAQPLPQDKICEILDVTAEELEAVVELLATELKAAKRGIGLRTTAAGVELVTAPDCYAYVSRVRQQEDKLSKASLETLAVIAFKQPVTKADIEQLRGVNCEKTIKQLLQRELIEELGRREGLGRPMLYGTTPLFLRSVGLNSDDELRAFIEKETEGLDNEFGESGAEGLDGEVNMDASADGKVPDDEDAIDADTGAALSVSSQEG